MTDHLTILPPALRQRIYELILPDGETITASRPVPGITQASQLFRRETTILWRSRNTFIIRFSDITKAGMEGERTKKGGFVSGAYILKHSGLQHVQNLLLFDDITSCIAGDGCGLKVMLELSGKEYTVTLSWSPKCTDEKAAAAQIKTALVRTKAWVASLEIFMAPKELECIELTAAREPVVETEDEEQIFGVARREFREEDKPFRKVDGEVEGIEWREKVKGETHEDRLRQVKKRKAESGGSSGAPPMNG